MAVFSLTLEQALLAGLAVAPLFTSVDANFNIIATACLTVYIGAHRSVKPTGPAETMSKGDAMLFPVIGSVILVVLFLLFKFLPKDIVNAVLTAYFVFLGVIALTATLSPAVAPLLPFRYRERILGPYKITLPFVKEPWELELTVPELVAGSISLVFCLWYYATKHWLANNTLGLAFAIQGIEFLALGSVKIGCILLTGLFFYDIFWVFFTPVMVTVAKSFDAPIKLLFPVVGSSASRPFSLLGLGDIVIPGIFVALVLRYDMATHKRRKYFFSAFAGYAAGLLATIVVMNVFQRAQPALLYIVPGVIGAVLAHGAMNGELAALFEFDESGDGEEEGEPAEELTTPKGADSAKETDASGSTVVDIGSTSFLDKKRQ